MSKQSYRNPVVVNKYLVVSDDDQSSDVQFIPEATPVVVDDYMQPAHGRVDQTRFNIPEANGLTWTDDFFDDEDDVVAVFDFDYEGMESKYNAMTWCAYGSTFLWCHGIFWTGIFLGVPCYIGPNVKWNVRSQHVAITQHGVTFVHDKRKSCWGWPGCDIGKSTITIPFDTITDCTVEEATGSTCLCIENKLDNVVVTTTGSTGSTPGNLQLPGLKNPNEFRKLVMAMKRMNFGLNASTMAVPARVAEVMERASVVTGSSDNNQDVANLLREIRDELRQHNQVLQTIQSTNNNHPTPSAPTEPSSKSIV